MKSKHVADLPSLRDLLAAGAHFGHRKEWSTPASKKYTHTIRDGVSVIDLEQTQTKLNEAVILLEDKVAQGAIVLFVGTKRQARLAIEQAGQQTGMPYVNQRWLGGTLTNFAVIRNNIQRMIGLEQTLASDKESAKFTKKERAHMADEVAKLHRMFDGVTTMTKLPDYLIVVDPKEEDTAVREAHRMGIEVMALCDTNANPDKIDFVIPANDDAPKAVELIVDFLAKAVVRGKAKLK